MSRNLSPIDQFYFDIMGEVPNKAGTAYERIATAAYAITHGKDAKFDQFLNGCTGSCYQLDGIADGNVMIEAKDYTLRDVSVGRGDLQKQEGALVDLPNVDKGVFASATDYTSEAQKYATGSELNPMMKNIVTYDIKPATDDDKKGRINKIKVECHISYPDFQENNIKFRFADGELKRMNDDLRSKNIAEIRTSMQFLYDERGDVSISIHELTKNNQPHFTDTDTVVTEDVDYPAFIMIEGHFYKIDGIRYVDVPIVRLTETFIIEARGEAKLLIRSEKDNVDKLITDIDLRDAIKGIMQRR